MKRVFLIVLDSFGIGALPDAAEYGDAGSNTLSACMQSSSFSMPNLTRLGLLAIDGETKQDNAPLQGAVARLAEASKGKDTTTGHWEIAGVISKKPMPVFPNGFPEKLVNALSKGTGRPILCNKPYSGTQVIRDYGEEHMQTGGLIVYTSADSVLQIAAHEEVVPLNELYRDCRIARQLCTGEYAVGRVIARPFSGKFPNFQRTSNRHDFSLEPPESTMLDILKKAGLDVLSVGKIQDIFAGRGITESIYTKNNEEGIRCVIELAKRDFEGLCFVNLVDFDMLYGHRNDVDGYAKALAVFDAAVPTLQRNLGEEDLLLITADHGCDPSTASTDHSREYVPLLIAGDRVRAGTNLGTRDTFADISATILDYFGLSSRTGNSMLDIFLKK